MKSKTMLRIAACLLVVSTGALEACISGDVDVGSDSQELAAPPVMSETSKNACASFCDVATPMGCPKTGDCMEICETLSVQAPHCSKSFDTFIECSAKWLGPSCAPLVAHSCEGVIDDYSDCRWRDRKSPQRVRHDDYQEEALGPYQVYSRADGPAGLLESYCDETGFCKCDMGGREFARCQNLMPIWALFAPDDGCCGAALPLRSP